MNMTMMSRGNKVEEFISPSVAPSISIVSGRGERKRERFTWHLGFLRGSIAVGTPDFLLTSTIFDPEKK
jgi:hypothetical protein